jgi:probable F420-dependent oxidoreductase
MRVGFALPQLGPLAGPDAVTKVAQQAEQSGYQSLWVLDRLLWPVKPQTPYPVTSDGSLPELYQRVLDPLDTLTFAAARTQQIALGTSVLNLPWYNPTLLARRIASIDVLSGGRLRVGLGIGWSLDEYEAVGAAFKARGKTADEYVSALKALWAADPVEFKGSNLRVAKSVVALKPIQKPHPPIYMAAYTPAAMQRTAREADGWFPVGIPLAAVGGMFEQLQGMVRAAGRDPARFELIMRANCAITSEPVSGARTDFSGTLDQIAGDIAATRKLGASELVFDVQFSPNVRSLEDILDNLEGLRAVVN